MISYDIWFYVFFHHLCMKKTYNILQAVFMRKSILYLLLMIICLSELYAANRKSFNYYFSHISSADGLSESQVKVILQDSYGFMWFGTKNGLNRSIAMITLLEKAITTSPPFLKTRTENYGQVQTGEYISMTLYTTCSRLQTRKPKMGSRWVTGLPKSPPTIPVISGY